MTLYIINGIISLPGTMPCDKIYNMLLIMPFKINAVYKNLIFIFNNLLVIEHSMTDNYLCI